MLINKKVCKFFIALTVIYFYGCDQNQPTPPTQQQPMAQKQQPIQPPPSPPPIKPMIEDKESIKVEFVEVVEKKGAEFIVLKFTNTLDKKVYSIRGSVRVLDDQGNILRGYGYTDQLFNKEPGKSVDLPLLKIKSNGELIKMKDKLASLTYVYVANEVSLEPLKY